MPPLPPVMRATWPVRSNAEPLTVSIPRFWSRPRGGPASSPVGGGEDLIFGHRPRFATRPRDLGDEALQAGIDRRRKPGRPPEQHDFAVEPVRLHGTGLPDQALPRRAPDVGLPAGRPDIGQPVPP